MLHAVSDVEFKQYNFVCWVPTTMCINSSCQTVKLQVREGNGGAMKRDYRRVNGDNLYNCLNGTEQRGVASP